MTASTKPPTVDGELSAIKKRLDAVERRLNDALNLYRPEIVFSYSGLLAVSESPTWTRREAGRLIEVHARLRVAGSTETVIDIWRNDDVELTITIPADQTYQKVTTSILFAADQDVLRDEITTAGAGATDLTVMHRFRH